VGGGDRNFGGGNGIGGHRELKDVRLGELRDVAVREGWTHECKVWTLMRFTEVTVDEAEVRRNLCSGLNVMHN
jgi:hypothetical protein